MKAAELQRLRREMPCTCCGGAYGLRGVPWLAARDHLPLEWDVCLRCAELFMDAYTYIEGECASRARSRTLRAPPGATEARAHPCGALAGRERAPCRFTWDTTFSAVRPCARCPEGRACCPSANWRSWVTRFLADDAIYALMEEYEAQTVHDGSRCKLKDMAGEKQRPALVKEAAAYAARARSG